MSDIDIFDKSTNIVSVISVLIIMNGHVVNCSLKNVLYRELFKGEILMHKPECMMIKENLKRNVSNMKNSRKMFTKVLMLISLSILAQSLI